MLCRCLCSIPLPAPHPKSGPAAGHPIDRPRATMSTSYDACKIWVVVGRSTRRYVIIHGSRPRIADKNNILKSLCVEAIRR